MAYISNKLYEEIGMPKSASNAIAVLALQGRIPEITIDSIITRAKDIGDQASQAAASKLKDFALLNVKENSKKTLGVEIDFSKYGALQDSLLNFELNPTDQKLQTLLPKVTDSSLKSYLISRNQSAKKLLDIQEEMLFKKAADAISKSTADRNTQTLKLNGLPLLLVGAGVNLTFQAIDGHLAAKQAKIDNFIKRRDAYFTAHLHTINSSIGEEGFTFGFEDFSHIGVKDQETENWFAKPFCSPVQGLEIGAYWACIFEIYDNIMNAFNNNNHKGLKSLLASMRSQFKKDSTTFQTYTDLYNKKGKVKWTCDGLFKIFIENAVRSTEIILDNLPKYTTFTQNFGFHPTFLIKGTHSDLELSRVWTTASNASRPDILVSGSPDNGGWIYTSSLKNEFTFPEQTRQWSWIRTRDDAPHSAKNPFWKTNDLQALKRPDLDSGSNSDSTFRKTINSQRRFNASENTDGFYGNRTALSFDVTQEIPIFNAQWSAMAAVLLCYPEALDTLANNGYAWAQKLKTEIPLEAPNFRDLSLFAQAPSTPIKDETSLESPSSSTLANALIVSTTTAAVLSLGTYTYHKKQPTKLRSLSTKQRVGLGLAATTLVIGSGIATHFITKRKP
jgi:hypothetical protein